MRTDIIRGAGVGGASAFVAVLVDAAVDVPYAAAHSMRTALVYVALAITLATVGAVVVGAMTAATTLGAHLAVRAVAPARRSGFSGLFAPGEPHREPSPACAWIHGVGIALGAFVTGMTITTAIMVVRFRTPGLTGLATAVVAVGWLMVGGALGLTGVSVLRGRRLLPARWFALDPLASVNAALFVWLAVAWVVTLTLLEIWPRLAMVFSLRLAMACTVAAVGLLQGRRLARWLFAAGSRPRRVSAIAASCAVVCSAVSLYAITDSAARRTALRPPTTRALIGVVRSATDVDRDGFGSLLGENDCAPFDGSIHPAARDLPGDGIDQNCTGSDYVVGDQPSPWPDGPVPSALVRDDYSVLLVTIDTLRYDHTTLGGYERDTTPALARLAARGVSFDRFVSSGTDTRETLPTLICSRYNEQIPQGSRIGPPGFPRRLAPEAETVFEAFHAAGYRTGMFSAHEYFDGWGLDQGVDNRVNLASDIAPYAMAPEVTDRALQWLRDVDAAGERWFVWVHFYEPHFPYVEHPDSPSFGDEPFDRYDGEIRFADSQLAELVRWVEADPTRGARTIIAVTSDHGEQLRERGKFGHGGAPWDFIIHVPFVVAVPGMTPRRARTPASTIDIAPTLAGLAGVPPAPSWRGRALVTAVTSSTDDLDRVVFSTDRKRRIFAAITTRWKLVHDDYNNLYQLVDSARDRTEELDASDDQPEVFARLTAAMRAWRETL